MQRGEVYRVTLNLPDRATTGTATERHRKLVVILQDDVRLVSGAAEVAVVIASSRRAAGERPFEVAVGQAEGFSHDTVIDGRWVMTVSHAHFTEQPLFRLDDAVMHRVSRAIAIGLQLVKP